MQETQQQCVSPRGEVPLLGGVHFCEVDVILADDSILVCLEGSIPGEAGSGRTHNGGMDIAGGTGRSWGDNQVMITVGHTDLNNMQTAV